MSASIETEWPYQQNLNIREIERTPISLLKFPLQITGLNYESPKTSPDTIEQVETQLHLKWLVEKYQLFKAKSRLARISPRSAALNDLEPTDVYGVSSLLPRSLLPQHAPPTVASRGHAQWHWPHVRHHGYNPVIAGRLAPMLASDQWLVPKPYDASVNINTERRQVSSTPTSVTLTAPGTPV